MLTDIIVIDYIRDMLFQLLFLTGVLLLVFDVTLRAKRQLRCEYGGNFI
jgi:hypothetical protein